TRAGPLQLRRPDDRHARARWRPARAGHVRGCASLEGRFLDVDFCVGPLFDDGGRLLHTAPGGAFTEMVSLPPTLRQDTTRSPWGVGTVPAAEVTEVPGCGSTTNVANPGEVGLTPST